MASHHRLEKENLDPPMKLLITVLVIIAALLVVNMSRRWRKQHEEFSRLPAPGEGTDEDVQRFVSLGRKMTAIKLYREIHGVDLKTAKAAVEALAKKTGK
jgi:ribosomal protein L7/L12